jgi:N-acetylmuramoyl-L-alanine amidase
MVLIVIPNLFYTCYNTDLEGGDEEVKNNIFPIKKGDSPNMKSMLFKKVSASLIVLMLLSSMLPVFAFASVYFKDLVYKNGTVTGQVYVSNSVAGSVYGNKFIVDITKNNGSTSTTTATYSSKDGVFTYYTIDETVSGATYLDLLAHQFITLDNSVTHEVYELQSAVTRVKDSTPSSNGGGFVFIPSLVDYNGNISASALISAFADKSIVEIEITGDVATIPGSALAEIAKKNPNAILVIKNATGSYSLPLSAIDYEALAKQLGVSLANLNIKVQIKALKGAEAQSVVDAIKTFGGKTVAPVVDFLVTAEGNGKSVAVKDFGNTYVARTINGSADFAKTVTGVVYNAKSGVSFVPSTVAGKVATLKSTSNSIYTVVEFNKSFADVTGKWSEKYVESMANKLIVNGYETGLFQPNRAITRAEFAALVVRALGLSSKTASANFSDVAATAWYANDVAVAAQAGIVKGDGNNTFRPSDVISRKELAAMVVRASEYAGTKLAADASALAQFKDASNLGWAQAEVSAAVKAGIVNGLGAGVLGADQTSTRAEAATMLQRFLVNAKFINE